MRDVIKNTSSGKHRPNSHRNKRRRKRNLTFHYILVAVLVIVVGTTLSLTVFFNVNEIKVIGEAAYENQMIIDCSNIKIGDNLLRANLKKAEDKISRQLVYIDTVKVKRGFPDKIIIDITPSIAFACLENEGKYLLISKTGKILENQSKPSEGLFIIKGYTPVSTSLGTYITSGDDSKDKLLNTIYSELENIQIDKNMEIDIEDKYNIKLLYDDRINIELGSQNEIEYKIKYAKTVIDSNISEKKRGTIFMLGDNKASFVEESDLEKFYQDYENTKKSATEENTEATSEITVQTE